MDTNATMQQPEQRRHIRRNALLLAVSALVVYAGFIVVFISSRS